MDEGQRIASTKSGSTPSRQQIPTPHCVVHQFPSYLEAIRVTQEAFENSGDLSNDSSEQSSHPTCSSRPAQQMTSSQEKEPESNSASPNTTGTPAAQIETDIGEESVMDNDQGKTVNGSSGVQTSTSSSVGSLSSSSVGQTLADLLNDTSQGQGNDSDMQNQGSGISPATTADNHSDLEHNTSEPRSVPETYGLQFPASLSAVTADTGSASDLRLRLLEEARAMKEMESSSSGINPAGISFNLRKVVTTPPSSGSKVDKNNLENVRTPIVVAPKDTAVNYEANMLGTIGEQPPRKVTASVSELHASSAPMGEPIVITPSLSMHSLPVNEDCMVTFERIKPTSPKEAKPDIRALAASLSCHTTSASGPGSQDSVLTNSGYIPENRNGQNVPNMSSNTNSFPNNVSRYTPILGYDPSALPSNVQGDSLNTDMRSFQQNMYQQSGRAGSQTVTTPAVSGSSLTQGIQNPFYHRPLQQGQTVPGAHPQVSVQQVLPIPYSQPQFPVQQGPPVPYLQSQIPSQQGPTVHYSTAQGSSQQGPAAPFCHPQVPSQQGQSAPFSHPQVPSQQGQTAPFSQPQRQAAPFSHPQVPSQQGQAAPFSHPQVPSQQGQAAPFSHPQVPSQQGPTAPFSQPQVPSQQGQAAPFSHPQVPSQQGQTAPFSQPQGPTAPFSQPQVPSQQGPTAPFSHPQVPSQQGPTAPFSQPQVPSQQGQAAPFSHPQVPSQQGQTAPFSQPQGPTAPFSQPQVPSQQGPTAPFSQPQVPSQQGPTAPFSQPQVSSQQGQAAPFSQPQVPSQQGQAAPFSQPQVPSQQGQAAPFSQPQVPSQQGQRAPFSQPQIPSHQGPAVPYSRSQVPSQQGPAVPGSQLHQRPGAPGSQPQVHYPWMPCQINHQRYNMSTGARTNSPAYHPFQAYYMRQQANMPSQFPGMRPETPNMPNASQPSPTAYRYPPPLYPQRRSGPPNMTVRPPVQSGVSGNSASSNPPALSPRPVQQPLMNMGNAQQPFTQSSQMASQMAQGGADSSAQTYPFIQGSNLGVGNPVTRFARPPGRASGGLHYGRPHVPTQETVGQSSPRGPLPQNNLFHQSVSPNSHCNSPSDELANTIPRPVYDRSPYTLNQITSRLSKPELQSEFPEVYTFPNNGNQKTSIQPGSTNTCNNKDEVCKKLPWHILVDICHIDSTQNRICDVAILGCCLGSVCAPKMNRQDLCAPNMWAVNIRADDEMKATLVPIVQKVARYTMSDAFWIDTEKFLREGNLTSQWRGLCEPPYFINVAFMKCSLLSKENVSGTSEALSGSAKSPIEQNSPQAVSSTTPMLGKEKEVRRKSDEQSDQDPVSTTVETRSVSDGESAASRSLRESSTESNPSSMSSDMFKDFLKQMMNVNEKGQITISQKQDITKKLSMYLEKLDSTGRMSADEGQQLGSNSVSPDQIQTSVPAINTSPGFSENVQIQALHLQSPSTHRRKDPVAQDKTSLNIPTGNFPPPVSRVCHWKPEYSRVGDTRSTSRLQVDKPQMVLNSKSRMLYNMIKKRPHPVVRLKRLVEADIKSMVEKLKKEGRRSKRTSSQVKSKSSSRPTTRFSRKTFSESNKEKFLDSRKRTTKRRAEENLAQILESESDIDIPKRRKIADSTYERDVDYNPSAISTLESSTSSSSDTLGYSSDNSSDSELSEVVKPPKSRRRIKVLSESNSEEDTKSKMSKHASALPKSPFKGSPKDNGKSDKPVTEREKTVSSSKRHSSGSSNESKIKGQTDKEVKSPSRHHSKTNNDVRHKKVGDEKLSRGESGHTTSMTGKKQHSEVVGKKEPSKEVRLKIPKVEVDPDLKGNQIESEPSLNHLTSEELWVALRSRSSLNFCECGLIFQDQPMFYLHRSAHSTQSYLTCSLCNETAQDDHAFLTHFFEGHLKQA